MANAEIVTVDDLRLMLSHVMKNMYHPKDKNRQSDRLEEICWKLFSKDYKCSVIDNTNGDLCSHYPAKVILPEYQVDGKDADNEGFQSMYEPEKMKEVIRQARFARCRARFPVPVIMYEGKWVCRSATISGGPEMYGRSGFNMLTGGGESVPNSEANGDVPLFDRVRGMDIRLLKDMSVGTICDLMVEKKKVKFGIYVTSSEKVDKERRYSEFNIMSMPYPGCEFFREWKDNGYRAEGMYFHWHRDQANAKLEIPQAVHRLALPVCVEWSKYKYWDLVNLTRNYLVLLTNYIVNGETGLLLHCISGWDRTPLFISLLRLSLWADGLIHPTLSALEILYLTIGYDWFMFGHNFPERFSNGEEIFHFCFHFLKYITEDVYDGGVATRDSSTDHCQQGNESVLDKDVLGNVTHDCNTPSEHSQTRAQQPGLLLDASRLQINVNRRQNPASPPIDMPRRQGAQVHCSTPSVSGSWQVISSTGSCGSLSSQDSSGHSTHCDSTNPTEPAQDSTRRCRLDAVRRTFLSVYSTSIDFKTSPEGLSGFLSQFAEKVGFKVMKGTPV